jgi:tetrapyrrole methylase family protein/MazG family protein
LILEKKMTSFVNLLDSVCAALKIDPLARGLQIAGATELARQHFPRLDPAQPALIAKLSSRAVVSDCKLTLMIVYPADHPVTRVDAAGARKERIERLPLAEIDHAEKFGRSTMLYVPPLARPGSFSALGQVVARLRAPDGCPWDRKQTHQSLRGDFLEEAYEVLETLDAEDMPHLCEELGDLLLHIFMQAQIAAESGEFQLSDVIAGISEKLVRRHPHVFGDVKVRGTAQVIANWEQIKQVENGGKKKSSVPRDLPALARAQKIAKRAKVKASRKEIAARAAKLSHGRNVEQTFGELLFALAAHASAKGIDAESALRRVADQHLA